MMQFNAPVDQSSPVDSGPHPHVRFGHWIERQIFHYREEILVANLGPVFREHQHSEQSYQRR